MAVIAPPPPTFRITNTSDRAGLVVINQAWHGLDRPSAGAYLSLFRGQWVTYDPFTEEPDEASGSDEVGPPQLGAIGLAWGTAVLHCGTTTPLSTHWVPLMEHVATYHDMDVADLLIPVHPDRVTIALLDLEAVNSQPYRVVAMHRGVNYLGCTMHTDSDLRARWLS